MDTDTRPLMRFSSPPARMIRAPFTVGELPHTPGCHVILLDTLRVEHRQEWLAAAEGFIRPIVFIRSDAACLDACRLMTQSGAVGVDCESNEDPLDSTKEVLAYLQIALPDGTAFLFNMMRDSRLFGAGLAAIFANPGIVKVFFDSRGDVSLLQNGCPFPLSINNMVDIQPEATLRYKELNPRTRKPFVSLVHTAAQLITDRRWQRLLQTHTTLKRYMAQIFDFYRDMNIGTDKFGDQLPKEHVVYAAADAILTMKLYEALRY